MKKVFSIFLAVLMLCTVLTACNNTSGNDDPTPTTAPDGTPTPSVDVTEGGKYMDAEYPYETLKLPAYTFTAPTVTIISNNDHKPDPTKADAITDIYGISYQTKVTTVEQYATTFISMYMADESPEICAFGTPIAMINKGYFLPLEEIIDFSLPLWEELSSNIESIWYKNHIYSINSSVSRGGSRIFFNKQLFEEAGMKTPLEYYEEGNWNWDTYRQLAMDMMVDSDADGIPEIYGAFLETGQFLYSSGVDYISVEKDGTVINNVMSEAISRAVNIYTEMYDLPCMYIGNDGLKAFNSGSVAMATSGMWTIKAYMSDLAKSGNLGVVPFPKDPATEEYFIPEDFTTSVAYSIPSNSKNANAAAAWLCGSRYNKIIDDLDTADEEEWASLSLSEQVDTYGYPYEIQQFLQNEFYGENRDKFTGVNFVAMQFSFANRFSGEFWFRPLMGEPWATIAAEIEPQINEFIDELVNAE